MFGAGVFFTTLGALALVVSAVEFGEYITLDSSFNQNDKTLAGHWLFGGAITFTGSILSITAGIMMVLTGGHKVPNTDTSLTLPKYVPSVGFTNKSVNMGWSF
jgi:hypothetical protein